MHGSSQASITEIKKEGRFPLRQFIPVAIWLLALIAAAIILLGCPERSTGEEAYRWLLIGPNAETTLAALTAGLVVHLVSATTKRITLNAVLFAIGGALCLTYSAFAIHIALSTIWNLR